eukprot:scaffold1074_cov409-Prasinococcus_capsulatus_cf.AAC.18
MGASAAGVLSCRVGRTGRGPGLASSATVLGRRRLGCGFACRLSEVASAAKWSGLMERMRRQRMLPLSKGNNSEVECTIVPPGLSGTVPSVPIKRGSLKRRVVREVCLSCRRMLCNRNLIRAGSPLSCVQFCSDVQTLVALVLSTTLAALILLYLQGHIRLTK